MSTILPPLAFIGGGNMASAIINGIEASGSAPAICVRDPVPAIAQKHQAAGRRLADSIADAIQGAGMIVLAVKPQVAEAVLPELAAVVQPGQIVLSILAGKPTAFFEEGLPAGTRVVRSMPNTPLAIGQGMVGLCPGKHASPEDMAVAAALFAPCGKVLQVSEDRMDAITAVSGSGPAYLFRFAEAWQEAALALGFSPEEAALLVGQTLQGSTAYLMSQDGFPAASLREQVTSPGGTTAAALNVLNERNLSQAMVDALAAAEARGRELSA